MNSFLGASREYNPYDDRTQPPRWIDDYPRSKLRTPRGPFIARPLTLSERTGPVNLERKMRLGPPDMSRPFPDQPQALGQHVRIDGQLFDEDGAPVAGALMEFWQANASGKYRHNFDTNDAPIDPNFIGSTRLLTGEHGRFSFQTIKPGAYPVASSTWEWRAPHIHVSIFGPCWMSRMVTQLFFPGEPLLAQDLLLNSIPSPAARERLIIRPQPTVVRPSCNFLSFEHRFVLRGRNQTPTLIDDDEQPSTASSPFAHMTTGPFFPPEFMEPSLANVDEFEGARAQGEHILLTGRVLDERRDPTVNSIVEIWQADGNGVFRHPQDPRHDEIDRGFFGWGRASTDTDGWYRFRTVRPGTYASNEGQIRRSHINVMVLASGILRPLVTTVFLGDPSDSETDPVLSCVTGPERCRLFAVRDPNLDVEGYSAYRFDIVLRGEGETPFFLD